MDRSLRAEALWYAYALALKSELVTSTGGDAHGG